MQLELFNSVQKWNFEQALVKFSLKYHSAEDIYFELLRIVPYFYIKNKNLVMDFSDDMHKKLIQDFVDEIIYFQCKKLREYREDLFGFVIRRLEKETIDEESENQLLKFMIESKGKNTILIFFNSIQEKIGEKLYFNFDFMKQEEIESKIQYSQIPSEPQEIDDNQSIITVENFEFKDKEDYIRTEIKNQINKFFIKFMKKTYEHQIMGIEEGKDDLSEDQKKVFDIFNEIYQKIDFLKEQSLLLTDDCRLKDIFKSEFIKKFIQKEFNLEKIVFSKNQWKFIVDRDVLIGKKQMQPSTQTDSYQQKNNIFDNLQQKKRNCFCKKDYDRKDQWQDHQSLFNRTGNNFHKNDSQMKHGFFNRPSVGNVTSGLFNNNNREGFFEANNLNNVKSGLFGQQKFYQNQDNIYNIKQDNNKLVFNPQTELKDKNQSSYISQSDIINQNRQSFFSNSGKKIESFVKFNQILLFQQ